MLMLNNFQRNEEGQQPCMSSESMLLLFLKLKIVLIDRRSEVILVLTRLKEYYFSFSNIQGSSVLYPRSSFHWSPEHLTPSFLTMPESGISRVIRTLQHFLFSAPELLSLSQYPRASEDIFIRHKSNSRLYLNWRIKGLVRSQRKFHHFLVLTSEFTFPHQSRLDLISRLTCLLFSVIFLL